MERPIQTSYLGRVPSLAPLKYLRRIDTLALLDALMPRTRGSRLAPRCLR